jgi:DNA-binding transcriptional MerR regulator
MSAVTIGRAARETGCKVQTIRSYEQIGLMPAPDRTGGNQRLYDRAEIGRLAFIRHARELGFSIDMIRELLAVSDEPHRPCYELQMLAQGVE